MVEMADTRLGSEPRHRAGAIVSVLLALFYAAIAIALVPMFDFSSWIWGAVIALLSGRIVFHGIVALRSSRAGASQLRGALLVKLAGQVITGGLIVMAVLSREVSPLWTLAAALFFALASVQFFAMRKVFQVEDCREAS